MNVGTANFTYKSGAEITTKGTGKLAAYLIEILTRELRGIQVKDITGKYPVNVTLPVGTKLTLEGTQKVNAISVTANNKSVTGKKYGDVTINTRTSNRTHNGGGN